MSTSACVSSSEGSSKAHHDAGRGHGQTLVVQSDLQEQGREAYLRDGGYEVKRYHE
jgi:hypothetical protein